jgi:hypothetical protein
MACDLEFRREEVEMNRPLITALVLLVLFMTPEGSEGASPTVSIVYPRGAQRGRKLEVRLYGRRIKDARELIFYTSKIKVESIKVINDRQLRVRIHILGDCPLGEHSLRLRCDSGLSELRTFWVGSLRGVTEKEPNNSDERAQRVPLNVTLQGKITNEDVDRFRFEARKGQRITADIQGMRLGTTMFDPAIAIIDSRGFIVAQSDDTALARQDGICSVIIPVTGSYILEVRESAYRGNGNSHYRLHLGTFPRPLAVMPPGAAPGQKLRVHFIGDVAGITSRVITIPKSGDFFALRLRDKQGVSPTAIPFRISRLSNNSELEPNNGFGQTKKHKAITLPAAVNGVIQNKGDADWIRIRGKKGQSFSFQVFSRRIGSPLDSVLTIHDGRNGRYLAGNDDRNGPDSSFNYKLPRDGEFMLLIRDHLRRGGADFVYRIEVCAPRPSFSLNIPKFSRLGQSRQDISIPRGNRMATIINAGRANFRGDLKIEALDLPTGVKVTIPMMHRNVSTIPVVFEADAKIPTGARLIRFFGKLTDKRSLQGWLAQRSELVYGPPNNRLYWQRVESKTALAVTNRVPFSIEIEVPKVPMVQNGALGLVVIAKRDKGYKQAIRLSVLVNPPGVGAGRSTVIKGNTKRAVIPMNANNRAQIGKWPIVVAARARVGDGDVWVSSQLVMLDIARPFVSLSFRRSAVELGKETEIVCSVKFEKAFAGEARARLVGLPRGVSAAELTLKKSQKELVFAVKTAANCRPGRYRNIYGQVICQKNGGQVLHRTGRAELRIDRPIVKKKAIVKAKPKAKKTQKRLSRLEQLRKQQKERQGSSNP